MFHHPNDYDDWLLSDETESDRTLCPDCDGTGRLCFICSKPQDQCECGDEGSGYDPVVCVGCNGTGFEKEQIWPHPSKNAQR
jgi:hypothetical protein